MPLGHGYVVNHLQPVDVAVVVFDVLPAAEVGQLADRGDGGSLAAFAAPRLLKPEYAESYDTNGLNLIETRWRC
jgi:hypothetical protein